MISSTEYIEGLNYYGEKCFIWDIFYKTSVGMNNYRIFKKTENGKVEFEIFLKIGKRHFPLKVEELISLTFSNGLESSLPKDIKEKSLENNF